MNDKKQKVLKILKFFFNKRFLSYGIFWSWNLIFAIFTFSLIFPEIIVPIIKNTAAGIIPLNYAFFALLVVIIPFASIILGITKFRKEPFKLLTLFYGIEIPLFMLCLLRFLLFRELNPGTIHLYTIFFVGIFIYFMNIYQNSENSGKYKKAIHFTGSNLLLIAGIYIATIVLFYAVPFSAHLVTEFFRFKWIKIFSYIFTAHFLFTSFIAAIFLAFTSTVFVGMPVALTALYLKNFKNNLKVFKESFGLKPALVVFSGIVSINIVFFAFVLNNQPQVEVFKLFNNTKKDIASLKTLSQKEKKEMVGKAGIIRKGLLNAYLSPYRYISSSKSNNHIEVFYKNTFKSLNRETSRNIQKLYNFFVKPFLYDGNKIYKDQMRAEKLYEFFFDTPIQKEERAAIKHAMDSTWDRDSIAAGLLNINEEKVLLTKQSVNLIEQGSWAEVTISEVYENKTIRQQEILYYFTMPENSVITGLWLSDEEKNPEKFSFAVSPRGAAQKIYKNEVRRRVDPSLLEMVGPNQYRLRAFPVQPRRVRDKEKKHTEKLYLKFSFICLYGTGSGWTMPKLSEKRNVYWSKDTRFTINGKELKKNSDSKWLPTLIKNTYEIKEAKLSCVINNSVMIKASQKRAKIVLERIDGKYAVLIDPSYSMNRIKDHTKESLEWIKDNEVKADIFRFDRDNPEIVKDNDKELLYFGSTDVFTILKDFKSFGKEKKYDGIIVLTDRGSYEKSGNYKGSLEFDAPVYLVHQDRKMPPAYNDALLETIKKSKGGVALYLPEVFEKMSFRKKTESDRNLISTTKEVKWEMENINPVKNYKNTGLEPLAALLYINSLVQNTEKLALPELDRIHRIAKKYSIVSPYSSMIVLVNKRQKTALKEAEKQKDRFERKVEKGKEILTKPNNPFEVSGTPEPEEWILIVIVMLFLGYMKRESLVKRSLFSSLQ